MGCKSKYRDNEAFGLQEGCSSVSQGRALEPAGDRRSRKMIVKYRTRLTELLDLWLSVSAEGRFLKIDEGGKR